MNDDPLYFPRQALALALLANLQAGITNAFTLFAPRRMGKTQFLQKDIAPAAQEVGFNVFYFSFMDEREGLSQAQYFHERLLLFAQSLRADGNLKRFWGNVHKVEVFGVGLEREARREMLSISEVISLIAQDDKPTLLLLDEVQELGRLPQMEGLVRSLRTGLDIHQQQVKTLFTGSSQNGLRKMFNDIKAPFFHFSHALDFPTLGKAFSDFLADIYQSRTHQMLDKEAFWQAFKRLNQTPMYLRAMVQDMIINPSLTLEVALEQKLALMNEHADFPRLWQTLSMAERFILQALAQGKNGFYTKAFREELARSLGVEEMTASAVQGNVRKLMNKEIISQNATNHWQLNNGLLEMWIKEQTL